MNNAPYDIRSALFRELFDSAHPYREYLSSGTPAQQDRWAGFERLVSLKDSQQTLLKSFSRKMPVLVISGIWCGDCMRQGPMLAAIAAASPQIDLRFIDNQHSPALRDELRIAGGTRVPVALFLSEDFFEVSRFGDRTLSHYRAKAARELGNACDSGLATADGAELAEELSEWLAAFERAQLVLRLSPFLRNRHND